MIGPYSTKYIFEWEVATIAVHVQFKIKYYNCFCGLRTLKLANFKITAIGKFILTPL